MNLDWRITGALNHLAAFEVAVDTGSFTKAAAQLGTTQPSVSRHISALENLLEVSLFDRLHHRVELTDAGQTLYDAVKLGLGHIRQAASQITAGPNPNTLSIGCTYGFAHLWLMPRFSALQNLVPDKELRMVTSDTRNIFNLQEVDFALRFGNGDWRDGDAHRIFGEELFPVCSPDFAAKHFDNQPVAPAAFATLPLIHEKEEEYSWLNWTQWLARHGVDLRLTENTYYYDNYALTLQAAIEGRGVALAWLHLVEPPLASGQLVEVPGLRVATDHGYYLACRHGHPMAPQVAEWFNRMARSQENSGQAVD